MPAANAKPSTVPSTSTMSTDIQESDMGWWPLVARSTLTEVRAQRDGLQTRNDILVGQMLEMRRNGFDMARPAKIHAEPDVDAEGLARAENLLTVKMRRQEFIGALAKDLKHRMPEITDRQAVAEAKRLRDEVELEDTPA